MSNFLTLQQIAWPISVQGAAPKIVEVGWEGRAIDGTLTATSRAVKREWKLKTIPLSPVDALAFQCSLLRKVNGNHWSFDNNTPSGAFQYSDKGLAPASTSGTILYTNSPSPKFGTDQMTIDSGGYITWAALIGADGLVASDFGFVVWFWNGSSWDGYAGRYHLATTTWTIYKNGTYLGSTLPGFITFSGSGFTLNGKNFAGTNANASFDDLVVFPYYPRSADLAVWSASTVAFAALPQLAVAGDVITGISPNAPTNVYGTVDDIEEVIVNTGDGGGLYDNAQIISFTLKEP